MFIASEYLEFLEWLNQNQKLKFYCYVIGIFGGMAYTFTSLISLVPLVPEITLVTGASVLLFHIDYRYYAKNNKKQ